MPPPKLKIPRLWSPPPSKPGRLEKVIPLDPGLFGVPVPSVQPVFCIKEMANWPRVLLLKIPLFGAVVVSWRVTE